MIKYYYSENLSEISRDLMMIDQLCFDKSDQYDQETFLDCDGVIAAKQCRQIVGYVAWMFEFSESDEEFAHLVSVAVHPAYSNLGIASKLIWQLINKLKNKKIWRYCLVVRCHNHPAIHLYHKMGFEIVDKIANYYDDDDGYEMERISRRIAT